MSTELLGRTIDDYRIEALLGQGGMGSVYRARDEALDRPVALKVLHPQFASEPSFQERFAQEARAIAQLDHPSIVKVHSFGVWAGLYYMVMEYVPGGNLATYLQLLEQRGQILHLNESLSLLAQVADALAYAHRRGIIHRDIKPDNILLKLLDQAERPGDPPLRAVVTDFGLVKLMAGGSVHTQDGAFMGTLAYMSPEQVLIKPVDARTDIYALGVVLYQLATGRLPLAITSATDAVMQHMNTTPPPPRDVRPSLPASVAGVIEKAMARNANERYASAENLAQALRQAAAGLTPDQLAAFAPPDLTISLTPHVSTSAAAALAAVPAATAAQPTSPPPSVAPPPTETPTPIEPMAPVETPPAMTPAVEPPAPVMEAARPPAPPETPAPMPAPTYVGGSPGAPPMAATPAEQRVDLQLSAPRLEVLPGDTGHGYIELVYNGPAAETLTLQVNGLNAAWYTLGQNQVNLTPGQQARVLLALHPPLDGSAVAGPQRYRVTAHAPSGRELAGSGAWLHVGTVERLAAELATPAIRSGRPCQITLRNTGNTPLSVTLSAQVADGRLTFTLPAEPTTLPPGESQTVSLAVSAAQRPWLGRTVAIPFEVVAQAGDQTQRLAAEYAAGPRLPTVALALLVVLFLALCGATLALTLPRLLGRATVDAGTPTATAGVVSVPTQVTVGASATPTAPAATLAPTFTPAPIAPIVAADVTATRLGTPPTLDGDLSEWAGVPAYLSAFTVYTIADWDGSDDLTGVWRLGWDDNNFYLALEVTDDVHVQTQTGNQIFRGDGVDAQIDTQRSADFGPRLSPDDFQVTLSPGDFAGLPPSAWRFRGTDAGRIVDAPGYSIQVFARPTATGYTLEAQIPWRDLATAPSTGLTLGIALNVNDNDTPNSGRQEVMKSQVSTRTLTNPTTWGTLTLK